MRALELIAAASICQRGSSVAPPRSGDLDCPTARRREQNAVTRRKRIAAGTTGKTNNAKPSRTEAEAAVRTLLQWIGDDPNREGLTGTPGRVVRAFDDWFSGYSDDPLEFLRRTF